jgi:hypothetical protein
VRERNIILGSVLGAAPDDLDPGRGGKAVIIGANFSRPAHLSPTEEDAAIAPLSRLLMASLRLKPSCAKFEGFFFAPVVRDRAPELEFLVAAIASFPAIPAMESRVA